MTELLKQPEHCLQDEIESMERHDHLGISFNTIQSSPTGLFEWALINTNLLMSRGRFETRDQAIADCTAYITKTQRSGRPLKVRS